jgi:hypothetical protein
MSPATVCPGATLAARARPPPLRSVGGLPSWRKKNLGLRGCQARVAGSGTRWLARRRRQCPCRLSFPAHPARMRGKKAALAEALTGQFDDCHAELARMLLDQIDGLTTQIEQLDFRIGQLIAAIPPPRPPPATARTRAQATAPARATARRMPAEQGAGRTPGRSRRSSASTRSPASTGTPPR